jgi:hypothetical protein
MTSQSPTISANANPPVPASRMRRGIEAFQAGRLNEAQWVLTKVLERAPETLEALLIMAGPLGVVAAGPRGICRVGMPAPFPADRRGGTMEDHGHRPQTFPLLGHYHDRRPPFGR